MKTPGFLFLLLLCFACSQSDKPDTQKSAIAKLIDDETRFAAAADLTNWQKCWGSTDESAFTIVTIDGIQQINGWNAIHDLMKDAKPFDLKLKRDNYQYTVGSDVAFVSFDQEDNWGGAEERKTKETRTLRKIDGEWKIVNVYVMGVSSFEKAKTGSFHVAKEKIAVDAGTSLRTQPGLGGMYVGFVEVPAGTDFTPLFAGLPHDMCSAPHWGYVFEGSMRLKYADGEEETVNKGEVFYLPAPHTAFVEKDVKFIDFSPEPQLRAVLDNIKEKMASQKAQAASNP
jgi:hypothetical protein